MNAINKIFYVKELYQSYFYLFNFPYFSLIHRIIQEPFSMNWCKNSIN